MQHDNTNRGAIWKNPKKERDTHPDFTGSLNVNGVEYWVSAWKRKDDAGAKAPALSFSIKPKDEQRTEPSISQRAQATIKPPSREAVRYGVGSKAISPLDDDMDGDSIPF